MIEEKEIVKRLNSYYKRHTPEDFQYGVEFYKNAFNECEKLSKKYNISIQQVCAITSCLSPRLKWEYNILATEKLLQGRRNIHTTTQVNKCVQILSTDKEDEIIKIINGDKTVSFYKNIINYNSSSYVTIDRWMLRIVYGEDKITVTPKNYELFKNACIKAARNKKLLPLQYQAIVWNVVRNENKFSKVLKSNKT